MTQDSDRVVVIGGGVIGIACAYYLARTGRSVTIVDQGVVGQGCSDGNCGLICPSHILPLAGYWPQRECSTSDLLRRSAAGV